MELISKDDLFFNGNAMAELFKNCASLSKVPFLKPELRGKPEAILAIVLRAKELDIPPMTALSTMHFIQGVPTLPAQTMLALARKRTKGFQIKYDVDHENKVVTATAWADNIEAYTTIWDVPRASALGLLSRDQYKKQLLTMLKWRATTDVVRVIAPDAINGIYSMDEGLDFEKTEIVQPSDIDEDFPIAIKDQTYGPTYVSQNGKFRSERLQDVCAIELQDYLNYLIKSAGTDKEKPWHDELTRVYQDWFDNFDHYKQIAGE